MTRYLADTHCLTCSGRGYTLVNASAGFVRLVVRPCACRVLLPAGLADRPTLGLAEADAREPVRRLLRELER